jgi:signal transduction histidine kinase
VLFLESAQEWFEKGDDRRAREMLPGVIERAYATLSELKTIHTAVIGRYWEADSIEVALHSMASAWGRRTGRLVDTDINVDLEGELPAREEGLLLRICTNAIGNSLMHSRVHELPDGRIWINLRLHQDQIELEVGDNGEGIHPSKGEGYGIMRMRQLATQLKTELELSSAPLAGTVIRVRAGLDREDR